MKIRYLLFFFVTFIIKISYSQNIDQTTVDSIIGKWRKQLKITPNSFTPVIQPAFPSAVAAKDSLNILEKYYSGNRFKLKIKDQYRINLFRWKISKELNDTIRQIKVLFDLNDILNNLAAFDDGYKLSTFSLGLAKEINNDTLQLYAIDHMSSCLVRQMKNDEVIKLLDSTEKHFAGVKHKVWTGLYANKGIAYEQKEDYKNAITYYLKSYEVANTYNDYRAQIIAQYNLGYLYNVLSQYDKSVEFLKRVYALSTKTGNKDYEAYSLEQLGRAYGGMDSLDLSVHYYQKALKLFSQLHNKPFEALTYKNIAAILINANKPEQAVQYAQKAVELAQNVQPDFILTGARQTLALALIETKRFKEAEKLIKQNEALSDELDLPTKIDLYEGLYQMALKKKDYKSALAYYKKSDKLLDSVAYNKKMEMVREIETKYQAEKKEKENQRLLAEKYKQEALIQQKNKQNFLLAGGLGMAVTVAGLFGFFYTRNRRQKRLIEGLQKDLHHRVKNNLGIISSLVDEIKNQFREPELQARLNDLHARIMSIHKIHEQLYKEKNVYELRLKDYLEKLAESVQKTYGRDDVEVNIRVDEKIKLHPLKTFPLGLIVAEFLSNSFKHAFKDKAYPGRIDMVVEQSGDKYVLKLNDNGPGPEKEIDFDRSDSYGIRIMKGMAKQMGARLKLYHDKGMHMELAFG